MKVCDKHQLIFESLEDQEDQIKVLSEYHEKLNVLHNQESIEKRKKNCQICFYGAIGKKTLVKLVKSYPQKKLELVC